MILQKRYRLRFIQSKRIFKVKLMNRKYKIMFFVFIIFVILFIILFSQLKFTFLQNDILFLKFLDYNSKSEQNQNEYRSTISTEKTTPQYIFDIAYKDINFANVNLIDTIKYKTLVNEKIAPGVSGEFDIIIKTNENSKYQIYFISKNEKPQNLKFSIANTNIISNKIENLAPYLKGNLNKGESKIITIKWNWNYENGLEGNIQDTKDAKNIDQYVFDIYTYGEII